MGYALRPRNKELETFRIGAFSWTWLLGEGVGLAVFYGNSHRPASYVYSPRKVRGGISSPASNDGFPVSKKESKIMALLAIAVIHRYKHINEEVSKLSEEERERKKSMFPDIYNWGVREDFLEKAEKFAEFAEKSNGFRIF